MQNILAKDWNYWVLQKTSQNSVESTHAFYTVNYTSTFPPLLWQLKTTDLSSVPPLKPSLVIFILLRKHPQLLACHYKAAGGGLLNLSPTSGVCFLSHFWNPHYFLFSLFSLIWSGSSMFCYYFLKAMSSFSTCFFLLCFITITFKLYSFFPRSLLGSQIFNF